MTCKHFVFPILHKTYHGIMAHDFASAMANQEHLKILAKGVDEWNKWRTTHPVLAPDLSDAILSRLTNIELAYIQPGRPMQNGRLESLNGKVRDEFLNVSWFLNLVDYNQARPHSSMAYRTPAAFAKIAQGLCSAERRKGPQPPARSSAPPSPLAARSGQVDVVH